jgi:hypothetical protein
MDVVIVKRNGDLENDSVDAIENLYKRCNYRKNKDFNNYAEWVVKIKKTKYRIQMYVKTVGKANMENKYEFPPPVADTLFFGDCAVVRVVDGSLVSLSKKEWNIIYETLFGGFEDLDSTAEQDNNEVDELSMVPKHMKTKTGGYLKDGFVVDDGVDDEDDGATDEDDEDEDVEDGEDGENGENGEDDDSVYNDSGADNSSHGSAGANDSDADSDGSDADSDGSDADSGGIDADSDGELEIEDYISD